MLTPYLATRLTVCGNCPWSQAIIGGPLVHESAQNAISGSCDCLHIEGSVLRLVLKHLGTVLDTRRGA